MASEWTVLVFFLCQEPIRNSYHFKRQGLRISFELLNQTERYVSWKRSKPMFSQSWREVLMIFILHSFASIYGSQLQILHIWENLWYAKSDVSWISGGSRPWAKEGGGGGGLSLALPAFLPYAILRGRFFLLRFLEAGPSEPLPQIHPYELSHNMQKINCGGKCQ